MNSGKATAIFKNITSEIHSSRKASSYTQSPEYAYA